MVMRIFVYLLCQVITSKHPNCSVNTLICYHLYETFFIIYGQGGSTFDLVRISTFLKYLVETFIPNGDGKRFLLMTIESIQNMIHWKFQFFAEIQKKSDRPYDIDCFKILFACLLIGQLCCHDTSLEFSKKFAWILAKFEHFALAQATEYILSSFKLLLFIQSMWRGWKIAIERRWIRSRKLRKFIFPICIKWNRIKLNETHSLLFVESVRLAEWRFLKIFFLESLIMKGIRSKQE